MPIYRITDNERAQNNYTFGVTYTNITVHNGRIHPPKLISYNKIEISDKLKNFLYSRDQYYLSTACYHIKSYLLGEMDNYSGEIINNEVFSKINSVSEADDGYIIINNNQKIKLGKLIVKIGDAIKIDTNEKSEAIGIEKFVDEYKCWYKTMNGLKFKILKGQDIFDGYNTKLQAACTGMLGSSCMNNRPGFLHLYSDNEEKVKLLTLVDDNGKIYGRSFLWNIDNKPFTFMDRIYGIDNYINNIFINYAKKEKLAYREQSQLWNFEICLPSGETTTSEKCPLKVKLNANHLKYLPYMDSLYIWNKWSNTFSTSNKVEINMKFHRLKNADGELGKPGIKILGIKLKNDY